MTRPVPLRVRAAIRSDRWFKRTANAARAIHEGLWLGLLDPEHLTAANAAAYARWDRYRDADYNRSGLNDWERSAVTAYFPEGSTVLVPSAGAGRELIALDDLGYIATGFDPSPELVTIGRRLLAAGGHGATLIPAPPDRVPPGLQGPFDAILMGWGGYVHIRGRSARTAFLAQLRSLVHEGAPMLLSFFLRAADDRHFATVHRIATGVRSLRRSNDRPDLGDTVAGTFDHYATWHEITDELAAGGFEIITSSDAPYPHVVARAV